jgi:hypothetical protein
VSLDAGGGTKTRKRIDGECRTFKETVAAQGPADRARLANAESFEDVTVRNGACYITSFAGPQAEKQSRDYFQALKVCSRRAGSSGSRGRGWRNR